jgi:DNA-binding response OmpR family regulator
MGRLSYEIAEALIYDPVPGNRSGTRSALVEMGFRRIDTVSTADAFVRSLYMHSPDLVLCELQPDDALIKNQISYIRSGMIGYNPFVVVIVTTWDKSRAMIDGVINAGADDVLLRPFSTGALAARVDAHAERRRGFVITHDYIGPDRRRDPTRISTGLFEPPNSLAIKTHGSFTAEAVAARLDTELRSARGYLNAEKMRRDAFQICVLRRLLDDCPRGGPDASEHLANVSVYARAVAKRNADAKLPKVKEYCDEVIDAAGAFANAEPDIGTTGRLDAVLLKLHKSVNPQMSEPELREAVAAAVATIRDRKAGNQSS